MRSLLLLVVILLTHPAFAQEDRIEQQTELGPVTARLWLEPAEPVIGDTLLLTLEVTAESGIELLMPEFGQSLGRFTISEFVPRTKVDQAMRTVATQRYRLLAPLSGSYAIPPLAIEFVDHRPGQRPAPEGTDAYELLTETLPFAVQSVLPTGATDALKPPLGELALKAPESNNTGWYWSALLLGLMLVALAIGVWWLRPKGLRQQTAYQRACRRLGALFARPRPDGIAATDAFFVELSDLVRHYLEDRFGLHAPELTTEEFLEIAAGSPDLTQAHQGFLQDFLSMADRVKFAKDLPATNAIESVLNAAAQFLEQTRSETDAPQDCRDGGMQS